jgi:hypothetical protein
MGEFIGVKVRGFMKKSYVLSGMFILAGGVLMQAMEPVHIGRPSEFRAIDEALAEDDWATIFGILDEAPGLVNVYTTDQRSTLVYCAVWQGNFSIAEVLLERYRADPNRDLYLAVLTKNIPFIKLLLEHGASPDLATQGGRSARKLALGQGNEKVLKTIELFDKKK